MRNPRYDDLPLLRLLEFYVLNSIGELSAKEEQLLLGMEPMLQKTFGGRGKWHESIDSAVRMPTDMPQAMRDMWAKNQEIARHRGETLTPQQFAEMFVDANFPM